MTELSVNVNVNLEEVKELRKELEKIRDLKKEINDLDEEDNITDEDIDIGDPYPRRRPKFPKYFCGTTSETGFNIEVDEDENIMATTNLEL